MPRKAIENIEMSTVTNSARIKTSVQSVSHVSAIRVYFVYDTLWWRNRKSSTSHHIITDLPVHRVVDLGLQGYMHEGNEEDRRYVLMVSDIDGEGTSYLEGIFPTETTYETNVTKYRNLVHDITQHLARLYRMQPDNVPLPVAIIAKDWTRSPSGPGWDLWRRGTNWKTHALRMLKPVRWEDLFIVGSAYCSGTCELWAEGALQTVEMLLKWFMY